MTALFESFLLTIICDVFSVSILTYFLFCQVRKPVLDSIIKLPLLSKVLCYPRKTTMSLYLTRQTPILQDKPTHIPTLPQPWTRSTGQVGTTPGPEHPQSRCERRSPHLSLVLSAALSHHIQDIPQLESPLAGTTFFNQPCHLLH